MTPANEPEGLRFALAVRLATMSRKDVARWLRGMCVGTGIVTLGGILASPLIPDIEGKVGLAAIAFGALGYAAWGLVDPLHEVAAAAARRLVGYEGAAALIGDPVSGSHSDVPLDDERHSLLEQISTSATQLHSHTDRLPPELAVTTSPAIEWLDRLVPEAERSLRMAAWLSAEADDLSERTTSERAHERIEDIHRRVAALDEESKRIAGLLAECEADLLASISGWGGSPLDHGALGERFEALADLFETHHTIVSDAEREAGRPIT